MDFTGERYIPSLDWPELSYEHWHRYMFASQFVAGKSVLDLACGEGFGSNFLAESAEHVVGVDIDPVSINHAAAKYFRSNLEFRVGRAESVPLSNDHAIDVLTCFETVEHLDEQQQAVFVNEVKRLLKPTGLAFFSTPNRLLYSDQLQYQNEFHRHEFYIHEYVQFLKKSFHYVSIMGQRVYPISYIWPVEGGPLPLQEYQLAFTDGGFAPVSRDGKNLYYVLAICSDQPLTFAPSPSVLLDLSEQATVGRVRLLNERETAFGEAKRALEGSKWAQDELAASLLREEAQAAQLLEAERQLGDVNDLIEQVSARSTKAERRKLAAAQSRLARLRTTFRLRRNVLAEERTLREVAPRGVPSPKNAVDVVVFPVIPWEFRFQRPQQLATQFAQAGYRVFYVETRFHQIDSRVRLRQLAPNVFGLRLPGPAGLSLYRGKIDEETLELWVHALNEFRLQAEIHDAIEIIDLPFWAPIALASRILWGWRTIYDCMDEHSGFGNLSASVLDSEEWLIKRSDLVLATSRFLYDKIAPQAQRSLLLPNATDFNHFNQPPTTRPLPANTGPIIGYYGALSHWFDVRMVKRAAKEHPEWQFVLIGHVQGEAIASLARLPNVALLGEQPYTELPAFLHQFAVAIIPFRRIPLTEATNPVKFFEYLSAGKPVVAVALPELEAHEQLYYPVRNESEFVPQLEAALAEDDPEIVQARIELARQNMWAERFATLNREIGTLYGRVAIVVVSYDNLEELRICLDSLWTKTTYPNFEVIVVDNGSRSEVRTFLERSANREPRLRLIFNDENLGFARANNIGIAAAGDCAYVVFLNDDTVVTPGWLSRMVQYLDDPDVGLVGPVTNWAGNEARIHVDYESLADLDRFATWYTGEHEREHFEIKALALYCAGVRKALLDELGPLDEQFEIGMFEDDDLSRRVREAGHKVICAEDIFVHHWGRTSFRRMDDETYHRLFAANRAHFEAKWDDAWQPHRYRESVDMVQPGLDDA